MSIRLDVRQTGLRLAALRLRSMATNARVLRPLAYKLRQRWHESEQRRYHERPWIPRQPSTLRRYRWKIVGAFGVRVASHAAAGVGSFTGRLESAITRPHQPGIQDDVVVGRGTFTLTVGIKPRGPVAYGNWFDKGAGSRPVRPLIVFDEKAERDGASDVQAHIMGGFDDR